MKAFRFGGDEAKSAFRVLGWTVGSALVAYLISLAGLWEVPVQYLWTLPVINTVLYALQQFVADNSK